MSAVGLGKGIARTLDNRKAVPMLIALVVLAALYYLSMPKAITLEDAGLFQMVCHLGGISHPPGYPLFTLICERASFGKSVLSGNLLSIYFALLAVTLWYWVVKLLTDDATVALIAMFAYGVSITFWSQAIIIEVYSFAACLFFLSLLLLLKFVQTDQLRYWYLFCFSVGLGLSNHWPLFVLSGTAMPLFLGFHGPLLRRLTSPKFLFLSILLLGVGLLPYLQLLLVQHPEIAVFGGVKSEDFFAYVMRSYYTDSQLGATLDDKLAYLLWLIPESFLQLGFAGLPFILIGLVVSVRLLKRSHWVAFLVLFLSGTFLLMTLLGFKFEQVYQGVFRPYPIISFASLSLWFSFGLSQVLERISSISLLPKILISMLILGAITLANFPRVDRSHSKLVEEYARLVLESLPANAVLIVTGDNQVGPLGFLNRVLKVRPDVTLIEREGLVFSNRLIAIKSSTAAWAAAIEKLTRTQEIKGQARPVFSIDQLDNATQNYGLYYGFNSGLDQSSKRVGEMQYIFEANFEQYLDYILEIYQSQLTLDAHEKHFVISIMDSFTRQYVGYALKVGLDKLNKQDFDRLKKLQSTLPGKLVTLESFLSRSRMTNTDTLLDIALSAEQQLNASTSKQHRALLYEYLGLIYQRLGNPEKASENYHHSLLVLPTEDNHSRCHLIALRATSDVASKPELPESCLSPRNKLE